MDVALVTVGDEILSGDTQNTNATWLAQRLSERGATVARVLTVPDDRTVIADAVGEYAAAFDAVVVTGGIGTTPDDVTMEAVADAFDREMVVDDLALADIEETVAGMDASIPDIDLDIETEASIPAGGRPLLNGPGLAPGVVVENVYVFPGIPEEMRAMFESVAEAFAGERRSRFLYTVEPEANIIPTLETARERFDVTVGCYPDRAAKHNRLKIVGTDDEEIEAAVGFLLEEIDASETPVERDWEA